MVDLYVRQRREREVGFYGNNRITPWTAIRWEVKQIVFVQFQFPECQKASDTGNIVTIDSVAVQDEMSRDIFADT